MGAVKRRVCTERSVARLQTVRQRFRKRQMRTWGAFHVHGFIMNSLGELMTPDL